MGDSAANYGSSFERGSFDLDRRYTRFKDISISEKILNTCLLVVIGIGYLVALANLYYTHQGHDGKPGISVHDVMINYHGSPDQTRLGSAINGPMEANLKYKSDKHVILKWIQNGATKEEYTDHVAAIFNRDCVLCHTPEINPSLPDLSKYEGVSEVAHAGGVTFPFLIRVSHIHLFGIAFILFFIGRIFLLCDMNIIVKRVVVVIPFAAMLLDVMSWFITKSVPGFAYVVVASGALMGISMGMQILVSIYQMWFYPNEEASVTNNNTAS
ncbi:MAG: hypothetical protein WC782_01415 [Methylococcaceae bacterium]|jgi:hypothetical protein